MRFDAFNNIEFPEHNGEFADDIGATGINLTITFCAAAALVHPLTVTVTEYAPLWAKLLFAMVGFCEEELNPFGPLHAYAAPPMLEAVSEIFDPSHNGLLLPVVGDGGIGLTTTIAFPVGLVQPFTVAVTAYDPDSEMVLFVIDGF